MVFKFKSGRLMIISQLVCLMAVLNGCSAGGSSNNTGVAAAAPDTIVGTAGSSPSTSTTTTPSQASTNPETSAATVSTVTATNSGDACLPITMPTRDVLFGSSKKVFAHYFYPYPLSIDNRSPAKDYYNTQFLNKEGESNKWSAQGGLLRQRPLPVNASSDPHWRQINMQHEVATAISRGITGFAFDVMAVDQATRCQQSAASDARRGPSGGFPIQDHGHAGHHRPWRPISTAWCRSSSPWQRVPPHTNSQMGGLLYPPSPRTSTPLPGGRLC